MENLKKELREFTSCISRNSSNLNQIANVANRTGNIYQEDINNIKTALQGKLQYLLEFREKVTDHIINQVIE